MPHSRHTEAAILRYVNVCVPGLERLGSIHYFLVAETTASQIWVLLMKIVASGATALLLLLAGLMVPQAAWAAGGEAVDETGTPTATLELTYTLYIGGISLGKVDLNARVQGDGYKAVSKLETSGVVNTVWRSKIEASSSGMLNGGQVGPAAYDSFSLNGANPQRREVSLSYGGPVPEVKSNRNIDPLDDNLKKSTLDPVSAMVSLVTGFESMRQKPCTQVAPVFDGRRRYDVTMSFVRNTDVKMDNGLYSGPVQQCRLKYNQIAGARQRIFEGKALPDINIWMTSFQSTADPDRHFVVPLRVFTETDLGLFVAVASRAVLDGKSLAKPK